MRTIERKGTFNDAGRDVIAPGGSATDPGSDVDHRSPAGRDILSFTCASSSNRWVADRDGASDRPAAMMVSPAAWRQNSHSMALPRSTARSNAADLVDGVNAVPIDLRALVHRRGGTVPGGARSPDRRGPAGGDDNARPGPHVEPPQTHSRQRTEECRLTDLYDFVTRAGPGWEWSAAPATPRRPGSFVDDLSSHSSRRITRGAGLGHNSIWSIPRHVASDPYLASRINISHPAVRQL